MTQTCAKAFLIFCLFDIIIFFYLFAGSLFFYFSYINLINSTTRLATKSANGSYFSTFLYISVWIMHTHSMDSRALQPCIPLTLQQAATHLFSERKLF